MRTSARLRGRRAVVAASLTVAGLIATTAVTLAQPVPADAPPHDTPVVDVENQRRRVEAAGLGAVRPVDPLAQLNADAPRVFATYDGIELVEPAADPLAIGFHQAGGSHPALTPVGTLLANENPHGTDHVHATGDGAEIRVMPSRGRGGSGTSAVDVALRPGTVVRSVVTGTVVAVEEYSLYGRHRDVFIEIQPAGRPDLRIVLYHLDDIVVSVGDPVFAGLTPIAGTARTLAVSNQVDRYAGECPCPHVDIRIRRS